MNEREERRDEERDAEMNTRQDRAQESVNEDVERTQEKRHAQGNLPNANDLATDPTHLNNSNQIAWDLSSSETLLLERHLKRKLDLIIIPWVMILYLFAYLDRQNIGNARLQGLSTDALNNNDSNFQWSLSIFYFGYILFEVPANLIMKTLRPSLWIMITMVGWGIAAICQAASFNFAGLAVSRLFLGIFESGFGPGVPLFLSFWYLRHEIGLRIGFFVAASALSGAFSGILAYAIGTIHANIANWRLLFIIEGAPTTILGILTFFYLPDRPLSSKRLSSQERSLAYARLVQRESRETKPVSLADVKSAFTGYQIFVMAIIYSGFQVAQSSITVFLPTIIAQLGYKNAQAQLLSSPQYCVAFFTTIIASYYSDRSRDRGLHVTILSAIGAIGYLILLVVNTSHAKYGATFLIIGGVYPCIPLMLTWVINNGQTETKSAIWIAVMVSVGQAFAILGTHLYPISDGPLYIIGHAVCMGWLFLSMLLALLLHFALVLENRKRDKRQQKSKDMDTQTPRMDNVNDCSRIVEKRADTDPAFRFIP